jgi:hypothetical protein
MAELLEDAWRLVAPRRLIDGPKGAKRPATKKRATKKD